MVIILSEANEIALMESVNPHWDDLAAPWFEDCAPKADPSLRSG
jgi:hypothetical protein